MHSLTFPLGSSAQLAHPRRRDRLSLFVENDTLDIVADVAPIEDISDIRQRHDDEPACMRRQRCLDALFYREEGRWIVWINAMGVANREQTCPTRRKPSSMRC
jgi:hypothetical protein